MKKIALIIALAVISACSSFNTRVETPATAQAELNQLEIAAQDALNTFRQENSFIQNFIDNAYGYAIFPNVGKAGFLIGGSHGDGLVYERGQRVGAATISQISAGLLVGGQTFSEIIFFRDQSTLNKFKDGGFAFGAGVSAVALTQGVSQTADYNSGVAVFTINKAGLMFDASVAGQKFDYQDL